MATPTSQSKVPLPDGSSLRIAIVAARWHEDIVERMLEAATSTLAACGVLAHNIAIHRVPGAYELPVVAAGLSRLRKHDAVIALGCVVRGETPHFDFVAGPVAHALQAIQVETAVPSIFGVLTTDTIEQALERSGGKHGNKGRDCAVAAIEMALLMKSLS